MSALELCRWTHKGALLLGYVYCKSPTRAVAGPSFEEVPSLADCHAAAWLFSAVLAAFNRRGSIVVSQAMPKPR